MRVVVVNHLSLDGVLQSPASTEEDSRGGFVHGGWAEGDDPALGAAMGEAMGGDFSWLLGHRTYDQLVAHWNAAGGPFKEALNSRTKHVASSHPDAALPWPNSELLTDVPAGVAALRQQAGGNLVVMGSGVLVRTLLAHRLVDEVLLFVHPVVLGSGARLFGPDDDVRRFALVSSSATESGVVIARYRAA